MTDRRDQDLFGGQLPDEFRTARERYGMWPVTVWDLDQQDQVMQRLKKLVGDSGEARSDAFQKGTGKIRFHLSKSAYKSEYGASIFNPVLATVCFNMWGPEEGQHGLVFDPFGGGGTRAIVAAKRGHDYIGIELRRAEAEAVYARCVTNGVTCSVVDQDGGPVIHSQLTTFDRDPEAGTATIIIGDARAPYTWIPNEKFDFLLTCPPYWTLETYSDDPNDLSNEESTYYDYLQGMIGVIELERRVLKRGARACWVVGLTRGRDGNLKPLHHDIARLHRDAGFYFGEEVILAYRQTGALRRVGLFEKGKRHLVRQHEYVLVFARGL